MENELVSIVIPVYNSQKYIEETIQTIKNQTYKNWEAIFVDDGSTDESARIIEKELSDKIKMIRLKENKGTAQARNEGIKRAQGKYLCYIDADDLWDKNKIEKQVEFMRKGRYAFSYTAYKYINETNTKQSKKIKVPEKLRYKEALKDTRILSITAMIDLRKIRKEDCYMKDIELEDTLAWWEILKKGYIAYGMNETLSYYRIHKDSKSHPKLTNAKKRWRLYREYEKQSIIKTTYYFMHYIINAVIKRM